MQFQETQLNDVMLQMYHTDFIEPSGHFIITSRLTEYVLSNKYMDTSIQKGGVPGCIEQEREVKATSEIHSGGV